MSINEIFCNLPHELPQRYTSFDVDCYWSTWVKLYKRKTTNKKNRRTDKQTYKQANEVKTNEKKRKFEKTKATTPNGRGREGQGRKSKLHENETKKRARKEY